MTIALVTAGFVVFGYLTSRLLRRNDVADGLWGLGFIAMALAHWPEGGWGQLSFSGRLMTVLVSLWGLRLSTYMWWRISGKSEDVRYANWRKEWGSTEPWRTFLQVFLLQGVILAVIAWPVVFVIQSGSEAVAAGTLFGVAVFALGLVIETAGDAQMAAFKKNPANKGRPLNTGLWSVVRHPNYLGEILIWWGLFLIALDIPGGWMTILSPLLLTFLLTKVSGVTMLARVLKERGPEYRAYIEGTPALFPLPGRGVLSLTAVFIALPVIDFLWLGGLMNAFYLREAGPLARLKDGQWDPILWAAAGVYVFMSLGLMVFAVGPARDTKDAATRGALFGLCAYAIYDFTNLSLLNGWSAAMAAVDIGWGAVLCGAAAALGRLIWPRPQPAR